MKFKFLLFSLIAFAVALPAMAQDKAGDHQGHDHGHEMTPEQQAEMQAWQAYMTPGEAHKMMASSEGEWKTVTKWWMEPGSQPMTSEGKSVNKMLLGGRYLQSSYESTVMGMPMHGMAINAYDNAAKKYIGMWIDNMGTGMAVSEGTYDPKTNTLTMSGTMVDPMSKQDMPFTTVMKFVDNNKHIMEMYTEYEGKEFKMMEIVYTRAKG